MLHSSEVEHRSESRPGASPAPCWTRWGKFRTLLTSTQLPEFIDSTLLWYWEMTRELQLRMMSYPDSLCSSHISQIECNWKNENWPDVWAGVSPAPCWTGWGGSRTPWPPHRINSPDQKPQKPQQTILKAESRIHYFFMQIRIHQPI